MNENDTNFHSSLQCYWFVHSPKGINNKYFTDSYLKKINYLNAEECITGLITSYGV